MFDFNKLGDMAKIASEAKQLQQKQDRQQKEQSVLLNKISNQLDEVIQLLKSRD